MTKHMRYAVRRGNYVGPVTTCDDSLEPVRSVLRRQWAVMKDALYLHYIFRF